MSNEISCEVDLSHLPEVALTSTMSAERSRRCPCDNQTVGNLTIHEGPGADNYIVAYARLLSHGSIEAQHRSVTNDHPPTKRSASVHRDTLAKHAVVRHNRVRIEVGQSADRRASGNSTPSHDDRTRSDSRR